MDIPHYAGRLREMLTELRETYGYSEQDVMLVLKDILAHEYMDNRQTKSERSRKDKGRNG